MLEFYRPLQSRAFTIAGIPIDNRPAAGVTPFRYAIDVVLEIRFPPPAAAQAGGGAAGVPVRLAGRALVVPGAPPCLDGYRRRAGLPGCGHAISGLVRQPGVLPGVCAHDRSEERRVGEEWRCRRVA